MCTVGSHCAGALARASVIGPDYDQAIATTSCIFSKVIIINNDDNNLCSGSGAASRHLLLAYHAMHVPLIAGGYFSVCAKLLGISRGWEGSLLRLLICAEKKVSLLAQLLQHQEVESGPVYGL
jgi:hypothetical protein